MRARAVTLRGRRAVLIACALGLSTTLEPTDASADGPALHLDLGVAHAVGDWQQREYGFGGSATVAGEWTVERVFGFQVDAGFVGLTDGGRPSTVALADHGAGLDFFASAGLRLHPFGRRYGGGLWLDGNVGVAFTGGVARASLNADLGYDLLVAHDRVGLGPFAGYIQVLQPDASLRPEDAHIIVVGLHAALTARARRKWQHSDRDGDGILDDADACPDERGIPSENPFKNGCPFHVPGDRDRDLVVDDEDSCPDLPGVRTADPRTNGCPLSDRDHDLVFDDEDACPDIPGARTENAATNGCPRFDRDNDLVFDDEDACPDVPGVRTGATETNGCPPAGDRVALVGDRLVLGDVIHFDIDSPRIRHPSWAICRKIAQFILANPDVLELDIEGYADETGTDEHNLVLSRHRAIAVKKLLVRFGVDTERVTTHGFGESRPRVVGHAEVALRENRRVEFTVTRTRARAVASNLGGGT